MLLALIADGGSSIRISKWGNLIVLFTVFFVILHTNCVRVFQWNLSSFHWSLRIVHVTTLNSITDDAKKELIVPEEILQCKPQQIFDGKIDLIGRDDFFRLRLKKKLWFKISQLEFHDLSMTLRITENTLLLMQRKSWVHKLFLICALCF